MTASKTNTVKTATFMLASSVTLLGCATTQALGDRIDDNRAERAIEMKMLVHDDVNPHEIDAEVVDGTAYLRGEVPNEYEKLAASQIAMQTRNVTGVMNEIEIQPVDYEAWVDGDPDLWYVMATNYDLAADPRTTARNIDVDAWDGVVYLSGVVEDEESKVVAAQVARDVGGVDRVVNRLTVENPIFSDVMKETASR